MAQGSDAGGHCGCFIEQGPTLDTQALLKQIVKRVKIPVIAAGGIMDAKDIINMLMQGAIAVQMGTAFLVCEESGAHPIHKSAILQLQDDKTVLTKMFTGRVARGINNLFITQMKSHENKVLDFPLQRVCTDDIRAAATIQKNTDYMSLWAGKQAYRATEKSASNLINDLVQEIKQLNTDIAY